MRQREATSKMSSRLRFSIPLPNVEEIPLQALLPLELALVVLTMAAMAVVDGEDTTPLAWALLLLIAISPFVRAGRNPEALAAILSVVLYGGLQLARTILQSQQGQSHFPEIFAGVTCFAMMAWVSRAVAHQVSVIDAAIRHSAILVEELTLRDTVTGAIKRRHAYQLLVEEIERSRRYNHFLSIVIVGVDNWEDILQERGAAGARELLVRLGEILVGCVRTVDRVSRHGDSEFALLLPETSAGGASIVAERIRRRVADETQLNVRAGIAEFPTDAVTSEELVAEANAALQFARAAETNIADRRLLN
jgi:diguanylate cyclase (GGDEF)-like protein